MCRHPLQLLTSLLADSSLCHLRTYLSFHYVYQRFRESDLLDDAHVEPIHFIPDFGGYNAPSVPPHPTAHTTTRHKRGGEQTKMCFQAEVTGEASDGVSTCVDSITTLRDTTAKAGGGGGGKHQ